MTRGQCGWLTFTVRDLHPLHFAGFHRRTLTPGFRRGEQRERRRSVCCTPSLARRCSAMLCRESKVALHHPKALLGPRGLALATMPSIVRSLPVSLASRVVSTQITPC
jgi:hypothetical protein